MTDAVTYTLVDPITLGTRSIEQLTFRPPTGKDIMDVGNPFDMITGRSDAAVMGAMIGRLSSTEALFIERLSLTDWNGCVAALSRFLQAPGAIS